MTQDHDLLLVAEKLGCALDRLERIETELQTQALPIQGAAAAQASALTALEAALAGVKALNQHVLGNDLGALSARVEEAGKQVESEIARIDHALGQTADKIEAKIEATRAELAAATATRHELSAEREAGEAKLAEARKEFSASLASLRSEFAETVKKFATPAAFTPRGEWVDGTAYARLDVVTVAGSSYVSTEDGNRQKPGARSTTSWQVLARRGSIGNGAVTNFAEIGGRPTTLAGYGITDAAAADLSNAAARLVLAGKSNAIRCVGSTPALYQSVSLSNGTDTVRSSRLAVKNPAWATNIRLAYANIQISTADVESGPGNAITVTAGVEYNGVTYPATFGGLSSIVLPAGGEVWTDPVPLDIPAGATFYARSCVTVASGQFWNNNQVCVVGTDTWQASDVTTSTGAMTQTTASPVFGPHAILGDSPLSPSSSVLVVGDSVGLGQSDLYNGISPTARFGYFARALYGVRPYILQTTGGAALYERVVVSSVKARAKLYSVCDYVAIQLGINDIAAGRSLAQMQADFATLASAFANRGKKVVAFTLTPLTTSTNGFRDAANQTPTGVESVRVAYNNWLRTVPSPLTAVFDVADLVEANASNVLTRNGGRWHVPNTATVASGTATSGSTTSLVDTGKSWASGTYPGYTVIITGGPGAGQSIPINGNNATTLTFNGALGVAVGAGSTYDIVASPTEGTHPLPATYAVIAAGLSAAVATLFP